jgi:hypothetical protein
MVHRRSASVTIIVLWCAIAFLVATPWANASQLGAEVDLRPTRSMQRAAQAIAERAGVPHVECDAIFEEHRTEFRRGQRAQQRITQWTFDQRDLARDDAFDAQVEQAFYSIELRWNVLAREATGAYFDRLRRLMPSEAPAVDAAERAHRRKVMAKAMAASSGQEQAIDIGALLRAIDPALERRTEIAAILLDYEVAIDAHLKRIDEFGYTYRSHFLPHRTFLREARLGEVQDLLARADAAVEFLTRSADDYTGITAAARRAIDALRPLVPPPSFERFEIAANRSLLPMVFAGDGAVEPLLRAALATRDLSDEQRARLESIGIESDRAGNAAARRMRPLYDRVRSIEYRQRRTRAWFFAALQRPELAEVASAEQARVDEADEAWNDAVLEWQSQARTIRAEIQRLLGRDEPVVPSEAGISEEATDDDVTEEATATTTSNSNSPVDAPFVPFLDRARLEEWIASLEPSVVPGVRQRYEDLFEQYAAGRVRVEADHQRMEEAERRWRDEHPGEDPWLHYANDFGVFELFAAWQAERRAMERAFTADVVAMLAPAEAARWLDEDRRLRRERVLLRTRVRSAVDLVAVLDALSLSEADREALVPLRSAYINNLDRALVHLEENEDAALFRLRQNAAAQRREQTPTQAKAATDANAAFTALSTAVGDVNEAAVRRMADALSPEGAMALRDGFHRVKFPTVFAPSPLAAAFEALREPSTAALVGAELTRDIETLGSEFAIAESAIQRQTAEALEDWERPERVAQRERARMAESEKTGEHPPFNEPGPIGPLIHARYDLIQRTTERVRGVLGDSLIRRLPLDIRLALTPPDFADRERASRMSR